MQTFLIVLRVLFPQLGPRRRIPPPTAPHLPIHLTRTDAHQILPNVPDLHLGQTRPRTRDSDVTRSETLGRQQVGGVRGWIGQERVEERDPVWCAGEPRKGEMEGALRPGWTDIGC